jgi:hypothetical protein
LRVLFRHSSGMSEAEQIDVIQRSVINLSYRSSCDHRSRSGAEMSWGLPERCYGVPARGGFVLADERRHAADDFDLAREWASYRDFEDCIARIRRFVAHFPETRRSPKLPMRASCGITRTSIARGSCCGSPTSGARRNCLSIGAWRAPREADPRSRVAAALPRAQAQRVPWWIRIPYLRDVLRHDALDHWPGGYVTRTDGRIVYVPEHVDVTPAIACSSRLRISS